MKKLYFAICLAFCYTTTHAQVTKVLFLGNSYTYVNDLPQLLKDLAMSFGDSVITAQNTPGGYQLVQHATDATTLAKIAFTDWDYVIIQEQSQKPSFSPAQVQSDVYPYAKILNDSIKANYSCTETVFYMTWGRKNGDASNCASYPPICTYNGMQQRLRESYMEMADSNKATTAPVGVAWKTLRDSFPSIELYQPDESHPSLHGSYLAACVFYSTLFKKSTIGSTFMPVGIGTGDAVTLQTVATNTVLDSLDLWRINANYPIADFNYAGGGTITFTNTSSNGVTYFWDFDDGNTSTLESPNHTYASNGSYNVELIVFSQDSCFSDTISQNVSITNVGVEVVSNENEIEIYPNPANNLIKLQTNLEYTSIVIIDITGKIVKKINGQYAQVNISNLKEGLYFLVLNNNSNEIRRVKFIKTNF
jgi:hypothetical protein